MKRQRALILAFVSFGRRLSWGELRDPERAHLQQANGLDNGDNNADAATTRKHSRNSGGERRKKDHRFTRETASYREVRSSISFGVRRLRQGQQTCQLGGIGVCPLGRKGVCLGQLAHATPHDDYASLLTRVEGVDRKPRRLSLAD